MMMRHLLWKDSMAIKPLVAAILIGVVAIYFALFLVLTWMGTTDSAGLYVSIWILMPNLAALGAPALLVGGEEESGTLSWLRTLPVSWQKVADAKILVALGALAVVWAATSLCLFFVMVGIVPESNSYADSMLNPSGVAFLIFFSLLLLLCGFITAYSFRSPVVGLIAVVPLIGVASTLSGQGGRWLLTGDIRDFGAVQSIELSGYLAVSSAGSALLFVVWFVQRGLAFRRLTSRGSNVVNKLVESPMASAYRPIALVGASRPNQFMALIWQQLKQMGWLAFALSLVIALLMVNQFSDTHSYNYGAKEYDVVPDGQVAEFLHELAPLFVGICACWLGSLAFYGDNIRRRCNFFADRGISPTRIWFTRVLIPVLCCLVLVAVAMVAGVDRYYGGGEGMSALIVVMLSFGILVGQWVQRAVMTFVAAPAYAAVASLALLTVFSTYPTYVWAANLVAPVLVLASWCLCARWLTGRIDFGYHWRVIAYTALGITCPLVAVLGERSLTTPELMPQWRSTLLAVDLPAWSPEDEIEISPGAYSGTGISGRFAQFSAEEQYELLRRELGTKQIGDFVSIDDVRYLLGLWTPVLNVVPRNLKDGSGENAGDSVDGSVSQGQLMEAGTMVLLTWAREIRQQAAEGKQSLFALERVAEPAEAAAVDALYTMTLDGPSWQLTKLVDAIPNRKLRRESRRLALISEWRLYDQQPWRNESADGQVYYGKAFMRHAIGRNVAWIPLERTRSDRFIDKATRFTLSQLDSALPKTGDSPEVHRRSQLWSEAAAVPRADLHRTDLGIGRHWTEAYEDHIQALKVQFGSAD